MSIETRIDNLTKPIHENTTLFYAMYFVIDKKGHVKCCRIKYGKFNILSFYQFSRNGFYIKYLALLKIITYCSMRYFTGQDKIDNFYISRLP